jgi:integrase
LTTVFEFTESALKSIPKPEGRDAYYKDTQVKGLWIRVSSRSGRKTFYLDYRAYQPREPNKVIHSRRPLGELGDLSLKDARRKASELKLAGRGGNNPLASAASDTIAQIVNSYQSIRSCSRETRRVIDHDILPHFGKRDPLSIKTIEISRWHKSFMKPVKIRDAEGEIIRIEHTPAAHSADKALDIFKAIWNWAEQQQLLPRHTNPCAFVERNFSQIETERHYEWDDGEIARLAAKLVDYERLAHDGHAVGVGGTIVRSDDGRIVSHYPSLWTIYAFRFLVLTGVRKSEALKLRWNQINERRGIITWTRYKSKKQKREPRPMIRVITQPLTDLLGALNLIRVPDNPYVFVGRNLISYLREIDKVWERIRKDCALRKEDGQWARIHDLRHWYGDEAADAGLNEKQIMALMGHSSTRISARYSKGRTKAHATNAELLAAIMANKLSSSS